MTRFARSKGSKASNERVPEEATSWSDMKKHLLEKNKEIEENVKRKDALEKRNKNYKAFLEEKENDRNKNSSWAEFPDALDSEIKKNKKNIKGPITDNTPSENNKKIGQEASDSDALPEEQSSKIEIVEPIVRKKKVKSKKLLKITLKQEEVSKVNDNISEEKSTKKRKCTENGEPVKKRLKKDSKKTENSDDNKQKKKIVKENLSEGDLKKIEKKKQKRIKQLLKKKKIKAELKKQKDEETKAQENDEIKTDEAQTEIPNKSLDKSTYLKNPVNKSNNLMEKTKKPRDKEEHPRKKPLLPHKMFINGKELEIDYVDGFPVKKEDATRLKKLRREMISKGLPRSEINSALKLERRKAEKAFAREKKKVNYILWIFIFESFIGLV